jgi:hypothetical protein
MVGFRRERVRLGPLGKLQAMTVRSVFRTLILSILIGILFPGLWVDSSVLARSGYFGNQSSPYYRQTEVGFASRQKLLAHYEKHGREFGSITVEEYLSRAKALRDRPAGGSVLETVRPDGVITRFDRSSGDFIAFNPDGVIRTFFRPSAGEAYFLRQGRERR